MVFGFFTRKPAPEIPPESVPLPESPPPVARSPNSFKAPKAHDQVQLRTPSPSVDSVAHGTPFSQVGPTAVDAVPRAPLDPTPDSLTSLIKTVPAKVLHTYTLSRIPDASEDVLKSLATFFDTLTPPPKLHCVRCHKDYVDVENDDRSCLVPHDDESAEVERVGRTAKKEGRRISEGMEYETLWGCCGKVTEGNGDQGPPDGWCYEGKHTTDIKRARFRADSTPQNDKLVSCLRLNCHGIRSQMPRSSTRKRPRNSIQYKEASSEDDGSEGEHDSGMEEIVGKKIKKTKGKGKAKAKEASEDEDKMDVDEQNEEKAEEESVGQAESASKSGSVRGRAKSKPSASRPRARPPKSKKDGEEASASASAPPKRKSRPPKSKALVKTDSMPTAAEKRGRKRPSPSISISPTRSHRDEPPRTRSQSRTRNSTTRMNSSPSRKPKSSLRASMIIPDSEPERQEEKPRKKRKVDA
ncbi:unnamed protein product [Somion occarium]|uniref:Uncharacterized protein n=1 Tax=Somion occarium TaxID=3059160 RepID=A0ABP1CWK0_9APHY